MTIIDLQKFTKLPLEQIEVGDRPHTDIIVNTPHKGKVTIETKGESYGIFGGGFQYEKHLKQILPQIGKLENEAFDYFIEQWKETLNKNEKTK